MTHLEEEDITLAEGILRDQAVNIYSICKMMGIYLTHYRFISNEKENLRNSIYKNFSSKRVHGKYTRWYFRSFIDIEKETVDRIKNPEHVVMSMIEYVGAVWYAVTVTSG